MPDSHSFEESPELTPAEDDAVRRALADARHTDAMPVEVTARLDHALAGLYAERASADATTHSVASLEARRRRRYATRTLVAAAAVVVGGFGINAMLGNDLGGTQMDSPASLDRDGAAGQEDSAEVPSLGSRGATGGAAPSAPVPAPAIGGPWSWPVVHANRVEQDLQRIAAQARNYATWDKASGTSTCVTAAPDDQVVLARYRGSMAVVLLRDAGADGRLVELYSCPKGSTGHLVHSTVAPAR